MLYVPTLVHEDQSDQAIWSKLYRSDPLLHKFIFAETASEMVDAEHVLTRQVIQNIQLAPTPYLKSRLRAVPHLFFTSFDSATGTPFSAALRQHNWSELLAKACLLLIFTGVPFCMACFGIARTPVCSSAWIATAILQIPMYVEPRFWLPTMPALLVSGAAGAYVISIRVRRLLRKRVSTVTDPPRAAPSFID